MSTASVVAGGPIAQVSLVPVVAVVVVGFWGGGWRVEAGVCGGRECAELEFWPVGPPMVDTESRKYSLKSAAWVPDGVAMVDNRAAAGE